MDTFTDHTPKMADTLRSLSVPPVASSAPEYPPRLSFTKTAALTIGLIALFLGGGSLIWPNLPMPFLKTAQPAPIAAPLISAEASRPATPIAREVTGSGYVLAPQTASVYARRSALITGVFVQPGDRVTVGQNLIQTDDPEIRFAADAAKQQRRVANLVLMAARIHRTQTQTTLKRQTELSDRGIVALQQLEDAQTSDLSAGNRVEQAKADLEQAELAVRIANERIADLTIRAPISGTVTKLQARIGDSVPDRADARRDGAGLVTIARLDTLVIDADVAEKTLGDLQPGLKGEAVLDAYPDRPMTIAIQRIAPEVNAAKGTVTLRLKLISPPPGVKPGMAARIHLTLPQSNLQSVPSTGVSKP